MPVLGVGDKFPALSVDLPGGTTLQLPDALAGHYGVVLFYRGSWCPYCNAQLRAFQRSLDRLTSIDVLVAALSVNDEATTQDLIAEHGLRFPSVTAPTPGQSPPQPVPSSTTTRCTCSRPASCSDPGGGVIVSAYSSGAIGRLVPDDVIGLVRYLCDHARASRRQ